MKNLYKWVGLCLTLLLTASVSSAQVQLKGAKVWKYQDGSVVVRHEGIDRYYRPTNNPGPGNPGAGYKCGGCNVYGCYVEGGGCNVYGCYYPGARCNVYGCYVDNGGGCNAYGCWKAGGSCNAYGCQKQASGNEGEAPKNPSCS